VKNKKFVFVVGESGKNDVLTNRLIYFYWCIVSGHHIHLIRKRGRRRTNSNCFNERFWWPKWCRCCCWRWRYRKPINLHIIDWIVY
jgi:hypothetical protein